MAAKMEVDIVANDKASGIVDHVTKKVTGLGNEGSPAIAGLTSKIDGLARIGVPGMNSLSAAFGKVGVAQSSFLGSAGIAIAGFAAVGVAAGAFAYKSIAAASEVENLRVRLDAMLGSTAKGAQAFEVITEKAAKFPATLKETTEAAVSLKAFGADIETWLGPLGDVAGFMGISLPEAAQAMGRAFAGGAGAADIFRERGVLSMISMKTGIQDLTKLSLPEFRKTMLDVFTDVNGGISGMAEKQSKTFTGMMSMLADESFKLLSAVGGVLLPAAKAIVGGLTSVTATAVKMVDALLLTDKIAGAAKDAAAAEAQLASIMASLGPAAKKAEAPVESLFVTLKRQIGGAKIVADSWKDSLRGLEKDFATATANIKTKQAEFEAWIDKTAANAAARKAGGAAIGAAGMTDTQRQAQAEQQAQQLILEATRETGEKRIELLNKAAEYYEQSKAAEVAADLAAMQQMAANDAAQWEYDRTSLQAALQAKTEMYMREQQRLSDWIAEESAARANEKAAEIENAVTQAEAVQSRISDVQGKIADISADVARMDALLKDEKTLNLNAEAAKIDMARLVEDVAVADAAIKAPRDFELDTAKATEEATLLRQKVDALFPPEGLHRVVVIEYKTKASPVRPFSEGMEYIKKKMLDLPTKSDFTVQVGGLSGASRGQQGAAGQLTDVDPRLKTFYNTILGRMETADEFFKTLPDAKKALYTRIDENNYSLNPGVAPGIHRMSEFGRQQGASVNLTAHITINGGGAEGGKLAKELDKEFADMYRSNRSQLRVAIEGVAA